LIVVSAHIGETFKSFLRYLVWTVFQQTLRGLPGFEEEAFAVALAQTTLEDLEMKTGLSFGDLKKSDHFAEGGAPGTLELDRGDGFKRLLKPILSEKDIVV
jgi:hypothetical protein